MTASDVREKDESAAEEFCLQMGALIRQRTDGKPVRLENLRAIAEANAFVGFLGGIAHARSEQEKKPDFICSHGDYKLWGTTDCKECQGGRVTLYCLGDGVCVSCERTALDQVGSKAGK